LPFSTFSSHRILSPSHIPRRGHDLYFRRSLAAIEATLPDGREADRRPDGKGGYFIRLPHGVVDRLDAMREPDQTYNDLICRLRSTR
jgi:hypothetical protein